MRVNRDSDSNEIEQSCLQCEKHSEQRISTFRGIMIDSSDDDENADDSIRVNRESDSNEIDKSDSQPEKHFEQRISTLRGIMIDSSDDDKNADDSIRVNLDSNSNERMQIDLGTHSKLPSKPSSPGIQARIPLDSACSAWLGQSKQPPLTNTRRPKRKIPSPVSSLASSLSSSSSPSFSSKLPSGSVFFQWADIPANEFERFILR
jgi:hypothetical protein